MDNVTQQQVASDDSTQDKGTDSVNSHSFLPLPIRAATEGDAIRATINGQDMLTWPTIGNQPINEFKTPTQAFPTLFPYGTGDPTCPGRQRQVWRANVDV